jgi:hypothetical protein
MRKQPAIRESAEMQFIGAHTGVRSAASSLIID